MTTMSKSDAMSAFDDEYEIIMADTPELIEESYRLRYQVYCTERHFLEGEDGIETDEYDDHSHHILLVHRESRQAVGSARLIVGSVFRPTRSFPMQRLCNGRLPNGLPIGS